MTSKCKAYDVRITLAQHEQDSWLPLMKALVSSEQALITRFLIGGPEIGIKEGRRHVHVYVEFLNQTTVTSMKKKLRLEGLIHWYQTAAKNDYDRIRKHHTKELSKEDPEVLSLLEYPTYTTLEIASDGSTTSNKGKITDQIQQIIEQGGSLEDVKNASYGFYASHSGFVEKELLKYRKPTAPVKYDHLWIYGEPGTGKSSSCYMLFPGAHWQDVNNPKFEGYNHEDVVILNDMDNDTLRHYGVAKLKNLCDPQGTKCQVNYGCVHVQARIIVTSNCSLRDVFKYTGTKHVAKTDITDDDVHYLALKRRFRVLHIDKFLEENNLQLVDKQRLAVATTTEQCFEPFDPNRPTEYSECNWVPGSVNRTESSVASSNKRKYCDIGTQTDDGSDESTDDNVKCTFGQCTAPGMWIINGNGENVHLHRKRW